MNALQTITRRGFLMGSAAFSGGVAFGTYLVKKPYANPLLDALKTGDATFNPWVMISDKVITLIAPHADIGQGVASMQAALIAEELDVEFGQFEVSFGQPNAAYYNTALAAEAAPFLSSDKSAMAQSARLLMGSVFKIMGLQVTGGSSSVPDSFQKLRMAGAVARETLKKAASNRSGIAPSQLKTSQASVVLPDGSRIPYVELSADAAKLKPVTDVKLRDPSQWRLVGKSMQRLDVVDKSTGILRYGIDLSVANMLYAAVRLNPHKGAPLTSYDDSKAMAMRGIKKVVPITNGVAVVADNTWRAFRAAEAVDCKWSPAPYPASQQEHWEEVERSFMPDRLDKVWRDDGNIEAALSDSQAIIKAQYKAPYVAHQPLEPLGAMIKVTDVRVDAWVGHQMPRFVQEKIATVTGVAVDDVHLHNQYSGGSFGHRLELDFVTQAAEIAMQMPGETIKLTYSREQDFAQDFTRQIGMSYGQGIVNNGQVEAVDLQIATVSSSASQGTRLGTASPGPDSQIAAGAWNLPYAVPNFRVSAYRVPELAPTSSWRSVGASTGGFFAECFIDELIVHAGADPLAERLRLCNQPLAKKVLEAVGQLSNWGSELEPNRGRGLAFVESFGVPIAEVIEVTNTNQGIKIDKVYVVAEVGKIIDPVNFDNLVKGGVIWGLGHAINSEITYADGMAQQTNYHQAEGMRMYQCPEIIVKGLENGEDIKGIGEPPIPPAAPALANAIFSATGKRVREMPFAHYVDFV